MDIEILAKKKYPDPINGNSNDKEDFELRTYKAKIQRKAFIKGYQLAINTKSINRNEDI